ncbi:MAG: hypothetical protein JNL08_05750 [Planctomycetes bacterium]|nr:hypothetical protein [Planctomycetota bacterium]
MPRLARSVALAGLCAGVLATGGCTLIKPVVGAVTGPVVLAASSNGNFCGCDGRGAVAAIGVAAAIGALIGLVTGVVSDVQWLSGAAADPTANWWDPFKTNTSACDDW